MTVTVAAVPTNPNTTHSAKLITWPAVLEGNLGSAVELVAHDIKTVQLTGTLGSGGSLQVEGSNDGTNWYILNTDVSGTKTNLIMASGQLAAGLYTIIENPYYIRVNSTAGDGSTTFTPILCAIRRYR